MRSRGALSGACVALLALGWVTTPAVHAAQQPAAQAAQAFVVPDDLGAFIAEVARAMAEEPAKGRQMISRAARAIESREVSGENRLYAALLLARGYRGAAALARVRAYLADAPANRELGLAVLADAASFDAEHFAEAREAYAAYQAAFGSSATTDPLRPGVPLRLWLEEAMARVALLDNEDMPTALTHYARARAIAEALPPGAMPLEDRFRLRWYHADALHATGRRDEAMTLLESTRPLVKDDTKLRLQLEDFILFKQTNALVEAGRHAEARALLERRLPEFEAAPISKRRVTKLLDRVKLVDQPAPELAENVQWVGGGPHTLAALRGHVVVLEFLTSG